MSKVLIWDIPLRVFHWMFAICISMSLVIAFGVDDDSAWFPYHMIFGLIAGCSLLLRVVIGLLGSDYSRFRGLFFSPWETARYMGQSLFGRARRYIGHNPGTATVALVMFGLIAGLVWSGLNMANGSSEDLHEALAYGMLVAVGAHMAGLMLHTVHHRENIALSMITGKKKVDSGVGLPSSQPVAGVFALLCCLLLSASIFRGYDPVASTVNIPGFGLVRLGEAEHEGQGSSDVNGGDEEEDDDDD